MLSNGSLPPWCLLVPSNWSFPASLVPPLASLVPPRLSNWSFPVPPWCLKSGPASRLMAAYCSGSCKASASSICGTVNVQVAGEPT